MAHGFLQSFDKRLEVFSAGTNPGPEVNPKAIEVMAESGIDISGHFPVSVDIFVNEQWDYVITVCDNARETCPVFPGKGINRLHIGFEDPSEAKGSNEFVKGEFRRIRDLIRDDFYRFYLEKIKPQLD